MLEDLLPEPVWYDGPVIEEHYRTRDNQGMSVFVIGLDLIIPVSYVVRGTLGYSGVEDLVNRERASGVTCSFPGT
jgi:hypothetical protein